MSFFISSMAVSGLMSSPPLSKHTPLPTSVTLGAAGSPQVMSIRRGGRAAARPTAWIRGKFRASRSSPTVTREAGAVARRERGRGVGEFAGAHVVGGRVDEVAGEIDCLDDARQVGAVRLLRQLEAHFVGGLAVADESIGPERDRERCEALVMGRIGETVDAAGQHARERAGKERIERLALLFQSEQHGGEGPVGPGKQHMTPRQRLEPGGLGERAGVLRRDPRGCRARWLRSRTRSEWMRRRRGSRMQGAWIKIPKTWGPCYHAAPRGAPGRRGH